MTPSRALRLLALCGLAAAGLFPSACRLGPAEGVYGKAAVPPPPDFRPAQAGATTAKPQAGTGPAARQAPTP